MLIVIGIEQGKGYSLIKVASQVFIEPQIFNLRGTITDISLFPGKETTAIKIECSSIPEENFLYMDFAGTDNLKWIPRLTALNAWYIWRYIYNYKLKCWILKEVHRRR